MEVHFEPHQVEALAGIREREARADNGLAGTRQEQFDCEVAAFENFGDGVYRLRGFEHLDRKFVKFHESLTSKIGEEGVTPRVGQILGRCPTPLARDDLRQRSKGPGRLLLQPSMNVLLRVLGEKAFNALPLWDLHPWSTPWNAGRDSMEGWSLGDQFVAEEFHVRIMGLYHGPKGPTVLVTYGLEARLSTREFIRAKGKRTWSDFDQEKVSLDCEHLCYFNRPGVPKDEHWAHLKELARLLGGLSGAVDAFRFEMRLTPLDKDVKARLEAMDEGGRIEWLLREKARLEEMTPAEEARDKRRRKREEHIAKAAEKEERIAKATKKEERISKAAEKDAEMARVAAERAVETAQVAAKNAHFTTERARVDAETARITAEKALEKERIAAEKEELLAKVATEKEEQAAKKEHVAAKNKKKRISKVAAEKEEQAAERERRRAERAVETAQVAAKNAHFYTERARVDAETARITAANAMEKERIAAEKEEHLAKVATEKEEQAAKKEHVAAEKAYLDAENARIAAETGRVGAETARIAAETARNAAVAVQVSAERVRVAVEKAEEVDAVWIRQRKLYISRKLEAAMEMANGLMANGLMANRLLETE